MSKVLMYALIVQYIGIMIFSLTEKNWGQVLYWAGAIVLMCGVLIMGEK